MTEPRWGRFARALHEFEGWSARLRADFGNAAGNFVVAHRLVESDVDVSEDVAQALTGIDQDGYELVVARPVRTGSR